MAKGPVGKYTCEKCSKEISLIAKTRHDRSCDGTYKIYKPAITSSKECGFCNKIFSTVSGCGVHIPQCQMNPDGEKKVRGTSWNRGLSKETDERILKSSIALKESAKHNPNHGKCADPEKEAARRKKLSDSAKKGGFGGYQPNAGRSKKCKAIDQYGTEVTLQSSYELICSQVLDLMGVKWVRPGALKYEGRNYFPDFYLPEFDVYLDPKNDFKAKQDAEKIASVIKENNVKVYVLLKTQLNEQSLRSILDMQSADNRQTIGAIPI